MRGLLLYLSRQAALRRWVETSALSKRLYSRFVAGETLAEALAAARHVNSEKILVTLDHLGENVRDVAEAAADRDAVIATLNEIARQGIDGNVSIKLTQFGLDLSAGACRENVEALVRRAAELRNFVRVDMESHPYVDRTLDLVTSLFEAYGNVGAVIQAYLYRSEKDVEALNSRRIRVRLCKGAYLEPESVAWPRKVDVDANFIKLMQLLLAEGNYPGIATHDPAMLAATRKFASEQKIGPDRFEFQMLYGVRRDLQKQLVSDGYRLRLYVPFGRAWYPYFMRRLAERPANVIFLMRNLLR